LFVCVYFCVVVSVLAIDGHRMDTKQKRPSLTQDDRLVFKLTDRYKHSFSGVLLMNKKSTSVMISPSVT
jgi:hypothetical protein